MINGMQFGSQCAVDACIVSETFVEGVIQYLADLNQLDTAKRHENGFDYTKNGGCPIVCNQSVPAGEPCHDGERRCCGAHPGRFPYFHADGSRECCGTVTYDAVLNSCCDVATSSVQAQC